MFRVAQFRGPKYKKLNQFDGADSSEGEDVLFEGDNGVGRSRPQQQRLEVHGQDEIMFSSYDVDEDLRLPSESIHRKKMRISLPVWCTYKRCLWAVLIGAAIAAGLAAVIFWLYFSPTVAHRTTGPPLTSSVPTQTTPHSVLTPSESLSSPAPGVSPTSTSSVPGDSPSPTSSVPGDSPPPTSSVPGDSPPPTSVPGDSSPPTSSVPGDSPPPTSSVPGDSPPPTSSVPGDSPPPTSPHVAPIPSDVPAQSTINYTREFPQSLTEMTPEFYDLNGDDVLDIVLSLGNMHAMSMDFWKCHGSEEDEARQACMTYFGFYPCGSVIVAVDGRTGQELWRYNARMEVFSVTCPSDLTGDGAVDCMLCGRGGIWEAVDGRTGKHIWSMDYSAVNAMQNLYFPLNVGDLDRDGTVDFVNVNSGDPRYDPANHNRPPGRLLVISGKTGQKLLKPLLLPDMRESYMSPVFFRDDNGHEFILIGTGGETVEGGLWGITLESLKEKVEMYLQEQEFEQYFNDPANDSRCHKDPIAYIDSIVPTPQPKQYTIKENLSKDDTDDFYHTCPETLFHPVPNEHGLCVYRVIASPEKGVILPPVIVDMNNDQVDDIVISLYCGHTLVLDGKSGTVIWDRYIPGTESYSIPAPLFYNSDQIPDLLVRVNKGAWGKHYDFSYVAVVDGADGSLLWAYNSSGVGFMSATTLRGQGYGNDALLFISVGTLETLPLDEVRMLERVTQGAVTPHEVGTRRRREAIAGRSFSITDKLDTRLGLIKKRSSTGGGSDAGDDSDLLESLSSMVNPTGHEEDVNTSESTNDKGGSKPHGLEPTGKSSTLDVRTDTEPSESEPSGSSSVSFHPSTGTRVSSTTTLAASAMSATSSLPAPTSAEPRTTSHSADSASGAHLAGFKEASTAAQQSGSSEIGASVSPSASSGSKHDSQTTSSTLGGVTEPSQPMDVSTSQVAGRPSDTNTFMSSQILVVPSSAVKSPSTSEAASSSLQVAPSPSSSPVQPKGDVLLEGSLMSSVSHSGGVSPPSTTAGISSTSSDDALAVNPTNQIPPVNVHHIHSNSSDFDSHSAELQQSWKDIKYLRDNGWLDFTKNWQEVFQHDPVSEAEQFLEKDCHMTKELSSYVYFLTRAMIEKGHIHPLYDESTRVSYPNLTALDRQLDGGHRHGDRPRRHGGYDHDSGTPDNNTTSDVGLRHDWGCLHVIHPGTIASTPSFADLDGDGRLELVYFVPYSAHHVQALPAIPPKLDVGSDMMFMRVITLEAAFQEKIAPKLGSKNLVDFSTFLPFHRQPWTKYMGSDGDSHYRDTNQGL